MWLGVKLPSAIQEPGYKQTGQSLPHRDPETKIDLREHQPQAPPLPSGRACSRGLVTTEVEFSRPSVHSSPLLPRGRASATSTTCTRKAKACQGLCGTLAIS